MTGSMGYNKGEISEWNEGNFKTLRMHQAQDLINRALINPFKKSGIDNGDKFNYELGIDGINILFGEGESKYAESEYEEVCELRNAIIELIEKNPPCVLRQSYVNGDYHAVVIVYKEKWKALKEKMEEFAYKVRFYNDKHGLSTRNLGTKGLFG